MAHKSIRVSRFVVDNVREEQKGQPSKNSSDEGEDDSDEEVEEDDDEDDEDEVEDEDEDDLKQVEDKEEEFSSRESIRKLLEPFGKDKLIEIFKEAALKNSAILSRVGSASESDLIHRKVFVHGLAPDATSEAVVAAFSPFGLIEDCKVIVNYETGRCKGYAFVLFKSRAAATRALKDPLKQIGSRTTNCHLASSGPQAGGVKVSSEASDRKIIVNNVSDRANVDSLHTLFSKFGEIEEGPLGYDPVSRKFPGFAVFVYKTVEGCKRALEEPTKYFEGCEMYCRMAFEGYNKSNNLQLTSLTGTQAMSSALRANYLTPNYNSAATLMGHNLGTGSASTLMGHNLGSGTTILSGQNFGLGSTTLMGQNIVPGLTSLVGQNGGSGHFNPAAGLYTALRIGGGVTPAQSYGMVSANRDSGPGVNSISPSVISNYGTLSALNGLGPYHNSQLTTMLKPQSGVGSLGPSCLPPFFGQ